MLRVALWLTLVVQAFAQDDMRGAAFAGGALYTWGRVLLKRDPGLQSKQVLARPKAAGFGEGGCVDDTGAVYLQDGIEAGPLVSIAPDGKSTQWDARVEMHDCIATNLLGHSGVLITNHYGQVRFYQSPRVYREVYSFYTPSRQAGLLLSDVDGDGLPDIFAGNYWIRSPREFELPWRLFAINVRHETPDSATLRLALRGKLLYAAQGHMRDGMLLRYTRGADVTQLWTEQIVAQGLHFPHALTAAAFGLVVGENDGPGSRVFAVHDDGTLEQLGTTEGAHTAIAIGTRVLTVGRLKLQWWDAPVSATQRRK